jgi:hypothetical protein
MKKRSKKDGKTFAKTPAYSLFPGWPAVSNQYNSRWTAASIRYGGAAYDYNQSTQSGAAIGYGLSIYTPMVGNDSGVNSINALSCGNTSTTQLGLPLGGTTPATSPMCSGVW